VWKATTTSPPFISTKRLSIGAKLNGTMPICIFISTDTGIKKKL